MPLNWKKKQFEAKTHTKNLLYIMPDILFRKISLFLLEMNQPMITKIVLKKNVQLTLTYSFVYFT